MLCTAGGRRTVEDEREDSFRLSGFFSTVRVIIDNADYEQMNIEQCKTKLLCRLLLNDLEIPLYR